MARKKVFLGEWLSDLETVPTYRKMSAMDNGNLVLKPITFVQRRFAEAIKTRLNKDGVTTVSIVD